MTQWAHWNVAEFSEDWLPEAEWENIPHKGETQQSSIDTDRAAVLVTPDQVTATPRYAITHIGISHSRSSQPSK